MKKIESRILNILFFVFFISSTGVFAQSNQTYASPTAAIGKVVIFLLFVVLIIFVMAWFVKKLNLASGMNQKDMQLISIMPLTQKEKVVLLKVGETRLLIGVAPGNVNTLHVFTENEASNNSSTDFSIDIQDSLEKGKNNPSNSFSQYLKKIVATGLNHDS